MRWNVLFLLALLLGLTAALQCEDGTNCPDHATCCQMESGSFGCCPYEEAVCCQQDYCCPQFGRCDGARCQLGNGLEIAAARRFPALKTATEALHYQQQQQQQQQAALVVAAHTDDMFVGQGQEAEEAVLAARAVAAAAAAAKAEEASMRMKKKNIENNKGEGEEKEEGEESIQQEAKEGVAVVNVLLPAADSPATAAAATAATAATALSGGSVQCPDGTVCDAACCPASPAGYLCCPYADAVCCSDHQHCCPGGTHCNESAGSCDPNVDSLSSEPAAKGDKKAFRELMLQAQTYSRRV